MKNKKIGMLIAFSILTGAMITLNSPRLTKAESNDLIIFENGEFCKEISRQASGSSITDGKWHNDASWKASRVLLKEGIDLSNYESITLTYTNVGTANWVEFGIGNAKQYGELDYVTKGVSFISDGEEHNISYNINDFASATSVNCTWNENPHENTSLDMTNISGFCIKAGNVTVNVSKITATPKIEDKPVIDETILKSSYSFTKAENNDLTLFENGKFCKEVKLHDAGSSITDGIWHNDANWTASRVLFKEGIDLSNYESITLTYTNTGSLTYAEFGIGNSQSTEFDYVAKGGTYTKDGKVNTISYQLSDFASSTSLTCTWGKTHDKSLDMTNISGFCIKAGITINVSKITATPKTTSDTAIRFVGSVKEDKFANLSSVGFNFTLTSTDKNVTKDYAVETTKLYNIIDDSNMFTFENDAIFTLDGYLSYSLILKNITKTFTATITFYSYAIIDGVTYNSKTTTINIVNGVEA